MHSGAVIGIDIGGTNISIGKVVKNKIVKHSIFNISSQGEEEQILDEIVKATKSVFNGDIDGIGVGVPSLVDIKRGIVYNVQNIPSWKEVHLKDVLTKNFNKPIYINNDANCFAVGEKYFGKGKNFNNILALTLGTGLGAGIIINNNLYSGKNCGAGEIGSIPYKDHIYEYYCSGQFFKKEYGLSGHQVYEQAVTGDKQALEIFKNYGTHLGNALISAIYFIDPEIIILGGSVSKAFDFFKETMYTEINSFPYNNTLNNLKIEKSDQPQIAILGAAALYYDAQGINSNKITNL